MGKAPVALFVYNRLTHTIRALEALKKNFLAGESDLFIYSDAAKSAEGNSAVDEVRSYLKTISGFRSVTVIERPINFGLANSIIDGVSWLTKQFGKVIVLEDDLITSPQFLDFMNEGLDYYEREEAVISIHGYIYPTGKSLPDVFFLPGADCWGWATWRRGWDLFEQDGAKLLRALTERGLKKNFNFGGSTDYVAMLEDQIAGKNSSWAIRWYASAFLADKLTLYPGQSLVQNIGNDGSGTHSVDTKYFSTELATKKIKMTAIPVRVNELAYAAVTEYFRAGKRSLLSRLKNKLIRMIVMKRVLK
jgi:hypothetical protein